MRVPKVPARFGWVVLPFLLSIFMTAIISAVSTILALGVSSWALKAWPVAWLTSWMIGFPTLLVVLPIVRHLAARLVSPPT
ncbi:DUF2798 domain-containing protein [Roseococcus sp. YIM B11640]|uniref:DUF2798 domain-containing protein n=1 Tax=Roseococcus sp. YIM B11640 TaxID=3133973 RepID=UPI003C797265